MPFNANVVTRASLQLEAQWMVIEDGRVIPIPCNSQPASKYVRKSMLFTSGKPEDA
jgi:hypothetical protein